MLLETITCLVILFIKLANCVISNKPCQFLRRALILCCVKRPHSWQSKYVGSQLPHDKAYNSNIFLDIE